MFNRNTITLNGQESSEIAGLLIQELPPISKPLIRTEVEEIDGRDGDIVTALGYSAYDKEITIGLRGDYDIDEVIAYFDSQGTVIFSNEPDKYYNYQIIQQIDFERLVRFRTATVAFHVQPFKYSAEETAKTYNSNLLTIPNWTKTTNGITMTAANGTVSISGTATATTEFYLPISALNLPAGNYTFTANASGTGATSCSIRLIKSVPSDADSFGGRYVALANGSPVTITADTTAATYNYIWFYISGKPTLQVTLTASVVNNAAPQFTVRNGGNIFSRPTLTLTGTGTVNLSLNGEQLFVINFGETQNYLTIDTAAMEAYQGTPATLMNRYVDGDYDNFKLNIGSNTLTWSGDLAQIVINNYSRWI